jgi:hypothetical protein
MTTLNVTVCCWSAGLGAAWRVVDVVSGTTVNWETAEEVAAK